MSSISCGIIGLPNVGKSTLFNVLSRSSALVANYPFATIEPNIGIVPVPDERLSRLANLFHSNKIIPATVKFVDIAGLVAGASKGEGLGNQFLSHIRSTSILMEVVRTFDDNNVTHVKEQVNPKQDIEIINTELVLADLETINHRLPIITKEAKANPKLKTKLDHLEEAFAVLNSNRLLYRNISEQALETISELQLITTKPIIYVFNIGENELSNTSKQDSLRQLVSPNETIFISAKLESELIELDDSDASELRLSYGVLKSGLDELIQSAYKTLGLQSFITAGEKEVRAWTIPIGTAAPKAAGVIHGDFERGFIAAEVVNYHDLMTLGSMAACRSSGKLRIEGKDYIVQPDDIIEFRFNV